MEKRVFYRSKSYYISAVSSFLIMLMVFIYPLRKFISDENYDSTALIRTLFFAALGLLIALFSLIKKMSPDLVFHMRVLKFYTEKDGKKERRSINVLDLESVTLTDRLSGETEEINDFPFIIFRTKNGEEYKYEPIKKLKQIKRIKDVIRFLNNCPGVPPVLNDISNKSYTFELMPGTGSKIKH